MSMMELLSQMRERARAKRRKACHGSVSSFRINAKNRINLAPSAGFIWSTKMKSKRRWKDMIIKVIPKPEHGKEAALITDKTGKYVRAVTMAGDLAEEVAKGNMYFNAIEKDGKLHITGRVSARF